MVERALARRPTITGEQEAMVRRLTLDGDGVAVVLGQAGSGKTFALAAAREAWEASGQVVIGAAVARRAAGQLEDSSGIPSTSVAALLAELDGRPRGLPRRAVLVVDEAGMIPTRQLAAARSTTPLGRGRSWSWSAITASCPRSRPAARSARSPRGCRSSSCATTAARPSAGSATRSRCCATAGSTMRCSSTRTMAAWSRAAMRTRSAAGSSPTGGRRATPTAR